MFSFFSKKSASLQDTPVNQQPHSEHSNQVTLSSPNLQDNVTVSSMKTSLQTPILSQSDLPDEEIEYLSIRENPYAKPEEQVGSFGPLPMRGNSDKLQYGTGSMYLLALSTGGTYGFIRGWRKAQGASFKLRLNSVLNTTTRFGPWAANSIGVMTLGWSLVDMTLEKIRGETDYWNHVSAAFISGFIFKSTAGLKPATLNGALLSIGVGCYGIWDKYSRGELKFPVALGGQAGSELAVNKKIVHFCNPTLLMSNEIEEDDDYMSPVYLQSSSSSNLAETYSIKREKQLVLQQQANMQNAQLPLRTLITEARAKGLQSHIPSSNKGFKMLTMMGYKPGQTLGNSEYGLTEPLPINIKLTRSGIGVKRSIDEIDGTRIYQNVKHDKSNSTTEEKCMKEYRKSQSSAAEERRKIEQVDALKIVAQQLDEEFGVVSEYWMVEESVTEPLTRLEKDVRATKECDSFATKPIDNQFMEVNRYHDKTDLLDNCPGENYEDHDV